MKIGKNSNLKISFPELRGSLDAVRWPAFIEPKFDGELNKWDGRYGGYLINKYGKTRSHFPAVNALPKDCQLIGELYYKDGFAGRLYDLLKHKEDDDLNFVVFDAIMSGNLLERREWLYANVPNGLIISAELVHNKKEAEGIANYWMHVGFEGAVVKSLDGQYYEGPCPWVKIKKKDQNDYVITYVDPMLERIEVAVPGTRTSAIVGVKCPNKYKKDIKMGDIVTIEHQGVLPSGSLRHPVFIGKEKEDVTSSQE